LAIYKSRVEYLIKVLFNIKIESNRDIRYITLIEGAILTPALEVSLKGVLDKAIILGFGCIIYNIVILSRGHKKELKYKRRNIYGVLMILLRNSSNKAVINLSLEAKRGIKIYNKLYT
jgi:hypothetical protein